MDHEVDSAPRVICYSGFTYAERPTALVYNGKKEKIDQIEAQWASPAGKGFIVRLANGRRYQLDYDEAGCTWQVSPAKPTGKNIIGMTDHQGAT